MSSDAPPDDSRAVADVFDLLSDETRVRIVSELYLRSQRHPDDPCLSFSALYDRIDAGDSGRFNYHLNKLSGSLVERRPEGYALTPLGVCFGQFVADTERAKLHV